MKCTIAQFSLLKTFTATTSLDFKLQINIAVKLTPLN